MPPKKSSGQVVISLENIDAYRGFIVTWFADAATTYLINQRLGRNIKESLSDLCAQAKNYVESLKEADKERACSRIPLPLTGNDIKTKSLFDVCKCPDLICNENPSSMSLQPALSLEFIEYIKTFNPQITQKFLKREVIKIEDRLHGLAVIGADITHTYTVRRGVEQEWGYTFIEVPNPGAIDYRKLSGMVKTVVRSVLNNEGSRASMLVGVASVLVLIYGRNLYENVQRSPINLEFLRLTMRKGGNKAMVKAFEILSPSGIALDISRMGLASPLYSMFSNYPKNSGPARNFVEDLARAIIVYNSLKTTEEIYKALRSLTSENIRNDLHRNYGDTWRDIFDKLLQVRV
jgi:hypothetical protein